MTMKVFEISKRFALCAIALLLLLEFNPAYAATRTWLGSNTNWNDNANWSGIVPVDGDDVEIPVTGTDPSMEAGAYPDSGSFASFGVSNSVTVTCLGDTVFG